MVMASFKVKEFVIPKEPRLLIHKQFRTLRDEIQMHQDQVARADSLITQIEEKLVPARHHLAVLKLEESELKPLDAKLDELELQEKIEKDIVQRYRQNRQEKRLIAARERMEKAQEEKRKQEAIKQAELDEKERGFEKQRKELLLALKKEMHEVRLTL